MRTRLLGAGLTGVAVIGLALACEKSSPTSAPAASKVSGISASAEASTDEQQVRWDIISIDFSVTPHPVTAGGVASALANDGSKITLTGSGTFRSNPGNPEDVTGGGTWQTFASGGASTGSGTYEVTGLVRFVVAPGTPPTTNLDRIGTAADTRAGLVFLRVAYSDGSRGVLAVSCHLVGTPDAVFEGVTASKGFAGFWNRMAPSGTVDANRTVFHVINEEED
jgi:hypothetical protein